MLVAPVDRRQERRRRPIATTSPPRRNRVTMAKATQFIEYSRCTSTWRHVAVLLLSPLPGLLVPFLTLCIPLQDPCLGMVKNPGFGAHLFVTLGVATFASTLQARAVTGVTQDEFSTGEIAAVAVVTGILLLGATFVLGVLWRFPVPFTWIVGCGPFILCIACANVIVLRERILRSSRLRRQLLRYVPSLVVQLSQIIVYPVYSALFVAAGKTTQIALIALFPLLKHTLKQSVYIVSRPFRDHAKEISIGSVEICASMYQALIMQSTPSHLATALVIAIDCGQGLVNVKLFMDHDSLVVPQCELLASGSRLLQEDQTKTPPVDDTKLDKYATVQAGSAAVLARAFLMRHKVDVGPAAPVRHGKQDQDLLVLTQALELLQSAEAILLVEYLETVIPIMCAMYLSTAAQLESAVYNPMVRPFYGNPVLLKAAMCNMVLYTALQGLTFLATCAAMRRRYRLSALTLLAFVLEKHAWSLQGKIIAWLPVLFAFSLIHYGALGWLVF